MAKKTLGLTRGAEGGIRSPDGSVSGWTVADALTEGVDDCEFRLQTRQRLLDAGVDPRALVGLLGDDLPAIDPASIKPRPRIAVEAARTHALGDEWPETVYRFVEHYKWEPQHLCPGQPVTAFYETVRRQEVPLTFLMNMVCVSLPDSWMTSMLGAFTMNRSPQLPRGITQCFPIELDQTQPDVRLESATDRIFLECKVGAASDLAQLMKYALLSAYLDAVDTPKALWVLYLTDDALHAHWTGPERDALRSDGLKALQWALIDADYASLRVGKRLQPLLPALPAVCSSMVVAHATWDAVSAALRASVHSAPDSEFVRPLARTVLDFVRDLERRGLTKTEPA